MFLIEGLSHVLPFLVGVTVLVFVHELGHYLVARWSGVRVETFSIGFGPELIGWNDSHGTRWRISAIPLGGYVMMFGDPDAISSAPPGNESTLSEADRKVTLHHQPLPKRAAIIAAGPAANYLYAAVVFAVLFMVVGAADPNAPMPSVIDSVSPDSAAAAAGIKPGDEFLSADGHPISTFQELVDTVKHNGGDTIRFVVRRDGQEIPVAVTPKIVDDVDAAGNPERRRLLGVTSQPVLERQGPLAAIGLALDDCWDLTTQMLKGFGQILTGARSSKEVGGLVSVGMMLDAAAQGGLVKFFQITAMWSINLGLVNLFPIPVLDGGHLLFYAAEAVLGRPLGRRTQELGFRLGLALVLTLMVFANGNDIVHRVIPFLKHLFT
jgi:regulator of sigma E protease